ncbi:Calcineurin-like phosphoesterase [Nocardioides alpinus]|uniref:Calcineurin-like phosphoesterase n=1 Tax=Nocardioides alpinus TaxID=748909 RepID=A0A1I0WHJ5_9ACTN|nr:metallophosphoesterase [Nocardioides alpinus]PKH37911.1 serine/threonine protein phosphatase [Nocardioides alpinus]SFA87708.1 Calcineurin-like phosphoesterase [Nocardioides alpinus]
MSATFATSDAHGHLAELTAALRQAGLVDDGVRWSGGDARLWVLGDLLDRGPDGLGVIALVRRLAREAADASGAVHTVLGNHEVIALGTRKFGDTEVVHRGAVRTFSSIWARNGGLASDQAGIDDELFSWLAALPAIARDGDHLLMHSDTVGYLEWGGSVEEINGAVREVLAHDDPVAWFDVLVQMGQRHELAGASGSATARLLLDTLGGERIVHGHSIIGDLFHEPFDSYAEPRLYADGLALDIDGGIYEGGPCLVARLSG